MNRVWGNSKPELAIRAGVSSLSWLKEHPVCAIKIDRGFIRGLADDVRD